MSGQTFYFLHIPKTAGTSVSTWLQAAGGIRFCPDNLWSQLLCRDRATLIEFDFFAGHFYTGLADYLERDLETFTFLRHPVERSISHYLHIMRSEGHYLHQHARRLGGFMAFMQDRETMPMLYNFQTRPLSMAFDVALENKTISNPDNKPYPLERHIESTVEGYSSAVNLPRAMKYLDTFRFVGITENFDESMAKLRRFLGARAAASPPPTLNVAANKPDFSPLSRDEYKMLIGLLADDMALYEYGKFLLHSS